MPHCWACRDSVHAHEKGEFREAQRARSKSYGASSSRAEGRSEARGEDGRAHRGGRERQAQSRALDWRAFVRRVLREADRARALAFAREGQELFGAREAIAEARMDGP